MTEKNVIGCCDTTDHGGRVLEGYALMRLANGHRVAGEGHMVWCPQCNGVFPIEGGVKLLFGYAPAVEGMRTACGARLVASQTTEKLDDDADAATNQRRAPAISEPTDATTPPAATGVSSAAFEAARLADAVHAVIRIGLFNDGTGNNVTNSRKALARCSPQAIDLDKHPGVIDQLIAECHLRENMVGASYAGGETNVHRLYDLYTETRTLEGAEVGKDGRRYVYRHVYIEGIGTRADHPDSLFSSALGWGSTGVIACAEKAADAAVAEITQFLLLNAGTNIIIDAVEFDLCGFSRGAASSRHLAWLILHAGDNSVMACKLRNSGVPLKPGWNGGNKSDLRIRFMGIYDTVAAIGIPDNDHNDPVKLYLADDGPDTVVHLRARDECRENFALDLATPSRHTEVALPGVHSDIGGGYAMQAWEQVILTQPEVSLELLDKKEYEFKASLPLDSSLKVFLDDVARASAAWQRTSDQCREAKTLDKDWLIDPQLNPPPNGDIYKIQFWTKVVPNRQQGFLGPALNVKLQVMTALVVLRQVRGEYQLVTLRIMHAMAQQAGVPFKQSPDDVPALSLPADLVPIYNKLLAYAQGGGKGEFPLTTEEQKWLSRRYLHQSAYWNPAEWKPVYEEQPDGPTRASLPLPQGADLKVIFPMRPAPGRKRLTFKQKKGH